MVWCGWLARFLFPETQSLCIGPVDLEREAPPWSPRNCKILTREKLIASARQNEIGLSKNYLAPCLFD